MTEDSKFYRLQATLDNGEVIKGDAGPLTEEELDEALDLITTVVGSKSGHVSLQAGGVTTIMPIQRIIHVQVVEVSGTES